jgi:hypothetical protein
MSPQGAVLSHKQKSTGQSKCAILAFQLIGQHGDIDVQAKYHARWALMAARGWARLTLDRRRDMINDRPNCATAAEAPLDGAQERCHFDNPTTHTHGAYQYSEEA